MSSLKFAEAPVGLDALCESIANAVVASAKRRNPDAFVQVHVLIARQRVVVAGALGFWPPLGAYEGVCGELEAIVQDVLASAPKIGVRLVSPPARYTVINLLERLPGEQARQAVSGRAPGPSPIGHAAADGRRPQAVVPSALGSAGTASARAVPREVRRSALTIPCKLAGKPV
ncbi:MAG: hypothetical protein AAFX85_01340 [Pseudomonadota bacterium]